MSTYRVHAALNAAPCRITHPHSSWMTIASNTRACLLVPACIGRRWCVMRAPCRPSLPTKKRATRASPSSSLRWARAPMRRIETEGGGLRGGGEQRGGTCDTGQ
eukprot:5226438-Pleurochrysis_carterae.AAC.3